MLGFWKQSREFVVILGMVGFFATTIYFGVIRIQEKNRGTMELIQQAIVDRKMLEEQSNGISRMRDSWEHIQSVDEKLHVFLPKDRIVSLVESLEAIGKELGVSVVSEASSTPMLATPPAKKKVVKSVAPTKDESGESSPASDTSGKDAQKEILVSLLPEERSIFITFKVTGSYDRVVAFLHKLDTMPMLLDVLSVEISPAPEKDESTSTPVAVSGVLPSPFATDSTSISTSKTTVEPVSGAPKDVLASFATVIYTAP